MMATCGVWMTTHRLVAVAVDERGVTLGPAHWVARNNDDRSDLAWSIEAHHGADCVMVVAESMSAADALPRIAARRGVRVLLAPDHLLGPACALAGVARASPYKLALMLARMPRSRPFAERLRRLELQLALPLNSP